MVLLKFLRKVRADEDGPNQYKKMKLSKLTEAFENMEEEMEAEEIALDDEHKEEEEYLETECARLREEQILMYESHTKEKESLSYRHKIRKAALKNEIKARVNNLF